MAARAPRPAAAVLPPSTAPRSTPLLRRCALAALAGVLVGGCQSSPPPPAANSAAPVITAAKGQVATPDTVSETWNRPDTQPPRGTPAAAAKSSAEDPNALAQHTTAFAESMIQAMNTAPRKARPPLPSEAQWPADAPAPAAPKTSPRAPARPAEVSADDAIPAGAGPFPLPAAPAVGPRRATRSNLVRPARADAEPPLAAIAPPASESTTSANQAVAITEPPARPAARPPVVSTDAAELASDVIVANRDVPREASKVSPRETDAGAGVSANVDGGSRTPAPPAAPAFESAVAQRLRDNPREVWAHLDFQMFQFLRDQTVPQLEPLAPLPGEDREIISALMDGLTNFRNALRADNNMLPSRKVRPILDLADRLRAQADLMVPTIALCTKVDGFGVYEPIDPARFEAGKEHRALVYCEVENFASQINEKKLWETRLSQEAVIYTETGMMVWRDNTKTMVDSSRNRRHDFYVVKLIRLPANLTIGRYLLKVTITDQQAHRVAEATTPVQIVATP